MRRRSKALTTLAAFGLIGGVLAGSAGASAPPDTGGGGEAVSGAGVGSGSDSGIEGADFSGTTVSVFGPENSAAEAGAMTAALNAFGAETGITIQYTGARDFEEQINAQVESENPPDIANFPQPGKMAGFARSGDVLPIPDDVLANVSANWDPQWLSFGNVDGTQYAIPNKNDLKSLVWYIPSKFAEYGYTVPTTLDEFYALTDQMIADGHTPLCVGIESGPATGWPFTDWVEELVLRNQGLDYYNQWVTHAVPFNDPPIVEAMQTVADLWAKPDAVYADGGTIAATPFQANAQPLLDGDCMMHRQASFFASFFPAGTAFGEGDGEVSTFYFPSADAETKPVLVAGTNPAAFRDAPEVWAVMQYFGSPEYANARQSAQTALQGGANASGFLSANLNADQSLYSPLEQQFLEVLNTGSPAGFDASDQMPNEVGSGTFWSEATSLVNGDEDAQTAADNIEASWPTS